MRSKQEIKKYNVDIKVRPLSIYIASVSAFILTVGLLNKQPEPILVLNGLIIGLICGGLIHLLLFACNMIYSPKKVGA